MGAVLNKDFFDDFAKLVKKKLTILWPSQGSTLPTESNIVTIFARLIENQNYTAFTEVPFGNNKRIDLLAINEDKTEMVLFEAKSGKSGNPLLLQEMKDDWDRLTRFSLSDLCDNGADINDPEKITINTIHICVGFWSEDKKTKILNKLFLPDIDSDEVFSNWIDIVPSGIGTKFFCKTVHES